MMRRFLKTVGGIFLIATSLFIIMGVLAGVTFDGGIRPEDDMFLVVSIYITVLGNLFNCYIKTTAKRQQEK